MEVICYVCNEPTNNWRQNFTEVKSQHSNTPIVDLLKRFLDDFETQRNIENESNCICAKCLNRIDDYDCMCVLCAEREKELKELLWATEKSHIHHATVLLPEPEYELNPDVDSVVPPKNIKIELDCEIKEEKTIDETDSKPNDVADPISIGNRPNEVWTIIEIIPAKKVHRSSKKKKQIFEPKAGNPTIPADYKNSVFKKGCRPHPQPKIPLTPRHKYVDAEALTEDQLKRYCGKCKIQFANARDYGRHMNKHHRMMCRICKFKLDNEGELQKHLKLHEEKANFQCVICSKECLHIRSLKRHVKSHAEQDELCDLCGKKFKTRQIMKVHRRIHFDENPYRCSHCPKAFKTYTSLRSHEKIHTSTERPFACSVCGMRFKLKGHCRVHEKRHIQNTKTERCTLCSAAYEHKFHLKQHMERRHGAERPQEVKKLELPKVGQ